MTQVKKILVIDDEPDLLNVICLRLKKIGYEVFRGKNGQEAVDMALQIEPDLIIMDLYLPIMNGDTVAGILKHYEKLKHIPVILISATITTLAKKAMEIGAVGYLTKPFEAQELIALIDKQMKPAGG